MAVKFQTIETRLSAAEIQKIIDLILHAKGDSTKLEHELWGKMCALKATLAKKNNEA